MGEPLVSKGWNSMAEESYSQKDEVYLISLEILRDPDTARFEHIETLDEKQSGCKVHRQRDGDGSSDIRPATDPGWHATTPGRRQGKCLVIDTTRCGIHRSNFGQRRSYTQHNKRYKYPAPDHVSRATAGHGIRHRSWQTVGHGSKDKTHECHLPCWTISR